MKTYAAIDIGTNSVLLLIGRIKENNSIEPLHEDLRVTRIGKGVYDTKLIKDEGTIKTLVVLKEYIDKCKKLEVENIKIVGTSALRIAENSADFLNLVKKETGISVEVISGEKEAKLSFLGAISGVEHEGINTTIIDIGGGSTEIIFGTNERIQYSKSLEIGSVRLTEKFLKSDPSKEDEVAQTREHVKRSLKELSPSPSSPPVEGGEIINVSFQSTKSHIPLKKRQSYNSPLPQGEMDGVRGNSQNIKNICIGVAGTVTTLAQIALEIPGYDRLKIENFKLETEKLKEIITIIKKKTIEDRKKITGLEPERADVILAGAIILEETMKYLNFSEVVVSTRGLRYGIMEEMIQKIKDKK